MTNCCWTTCRWNAAAATPTPHIHTLGCGRRAWAPPSQCDQLWRRGKSAGMCWENRCWENADQSDDRADDQQMHGVSTLHLSQWLSSSAWRCTAWPVTV